MLTGYQEGDFENAAPLWQAASVFQAQATTLCCRNENNQSVAFLQAAVPIRLSVSPEPPRYLPLPPTFAPGIALANEAKPLEALTP